MSALAKRFAEYISDDLPPEVRMPDSIELGNALLVAEAEIDRLRAIVRVNGLRWGHSHAEIDALLDRKE